MASRWRPGLSVDGVEGASGRPDARERRCDRGGADGADVVRAERQDLKAAARGRKRRRRDVETCL